MNPALLVAVIVLGVLAAAYFIAISRTDTFTGRWVAWKSSDVDDYLRFPSHPVGNAPPVFHFTAGNGEVPFDTVSYTYKGKAQTAALEDLLEATGTTAFIVIRDDRVLYEGYFNGNDRASIVTSFSIAKSVTSLLVGAAIDDGYVAGLDDPVTRYLPELLEVDPNYRGITLGHLLSMKSGIAFRDTDIPWHDKSRAYYHPHLRDVVTSLPLAGAPGEEFVYNTFNPILLGIVLERATDQSVAEYFEARLWQRLGMEYDASWSVDSEESGMAKMESGLNARAIDFAKIGRLVLEQGNWNGDQVVSAAWLQASTRPDPANRVPRLGEHIHYQLGWWIHAPAGGDEYVVFGWGHLGQYLFIFPEEDMLVLRFGAKIGKVDSWRQIAQQIVASTAHPSAGR